MTDQYEFFWHSGLFLVVSLLLFFISKIGFKIFNSKIDITKELVDEDNLAFYLAYGSYFVAFVLIIGGVMNSEGSGNFWDELIYSGIYGILGILVLNISSLITDKIFHSKISFWNEIAEHKNISVGILKGANYLGTGIIIGGIMLTEVDKPIEAFLFLISALLIGSIGFIYYNLIVPFNIREQIYKGNIAVSVSTAGVQIAFAILIHSGFQIDHSSWSESVMHIGIDIIGGFLILPSIRFIVDKLFLGKRKLTDELINQEIPNLGLGFFEAGAYISGALLLVWCWNL